ncbi:fucolectin-like isoform X2 [Ascaphus truei]|uniref:fucolectin-like isoform X2 n=1 Tax=Ascaphus truei TaxID=8439 RepID=UPI003F59E080
MPLPLSMKLLMLVLSMLGMQGGGHCCEPQPGAANLARNGLATQGSDYVDITMGYSKQGIDGNRDGNYHKASCTHTNYDKDPWWKLDLKQSYSIGPIVIANRQDCCSERLKGAEVRVGNSPNNDNPVCGTVTSADAITTLCCKGMVGRYVSVVIPGRSEYLTLCEVEVYEEKPKQEPRVCW